MQSFTQYESDKYKGEIDIEETFDCTYSSFTGLSEDGVPRVYTEEFAESKALRVYTPAPEDITHETTEPKLTLLFHTNKDYTALENERAFQKFIQGRKLVYHDTFRKKYYLLLMQKQPSMVAERLYGKQPYREVSYTFTNLAGTYYDENPINSK
jgi:hypothetical protein